MRFTKMHGLGNDYVYVNGFAEKIHEPATLARQVSDRHIGIGSDGLIIIQPSKVADVRMEMYNADGSRGLMCGNGIRCVAKYAVERGLAAGPNLLIETDSGIKNAVCQLVAGKVDSVQVDMGRPSLLARDIPAFVTQSEPGARTTGGTDFQFPISNFQFESRFPSSIDNRQLAIGNLKEHIIDSSIRVGDKIFNVTCVSMGNPHAVIFTENLHRIDLIQVGPMFEHAPEFPERINTHFVRVDSPDHVTVRTWERGSGATRACGTGACAVCVAGAVTGRTQREITVELPGGSLRIEWTADDRVLMTGEAVEVFSGEWLSPNA